MSTSQNGWPASLDRRAIGVAPLDVAGVAFPGGVRAGPVSVVLGYVAEQIHERVEQLVDGWCWGHAYRAVRDSTGLSNHASGTAIDINAPRHPLGQRGTWSRRQVGEIRRILAEVDHVVRWGGDYDGRVDEMHFEINAAPAAVERVAARLEDNMPTAREVADAILSTELDMGWRRPGARENHHATVRTVLSWTDRRHQALARQLAALAGRVAGQGETLRQLADERELDLVAIADTTEAAVRRALEESTVHVDVDVAVSDTTEETA